MNYRIPIGEFSKLSRLSRKALRLYEEQGLLRPIFIDPTTGYRYYAPIQVVESERIRALRMLEMPLSEIRLFLNERDPDVLRELLRDYRDRLERRVSSMRRTLDFLDRLTELREEIFVSYTVIVKDLEEQTVVSTRMITTLAQIGESMEEAFSALYKYREVEGIENSGICMSLYHCQEFDPEHMDVEVAVAVDRPCAEREGITPRILPRCTVASVLHKGPYEGIQAAYGALYEWIEKNGYEKVGPDREIYLNNPHDVASPEDIRTEVAIPVQKA